MYSFTAGLPVWWKTTDVHRAPLPKLGLDASANLLPAPSSVFLNAVLLVGSSSGISTEDATLPLRMLEKLQLSLGGLSKERSQAGGAITGSVSHANQQDGLQLAAKLTVIGPTVCLEHKKAALHHQERVCNPRWDIPSHVWTNLSLHEQDETLLPLAKELEPGNTAYLVFIVIGDPAAAGHPEEHCSTPVIGKYTHAWIRVSPATLADSFEETVVPKVLQVARRMIQGAIPPVKGLTRNSNPAADQANKPEGRQDRVVSERRRRRARRPSGPMPLAADGSALLSFSLLNAEPADWVFDWDFASAEEQILAPLVRAISPVAELAVESQVLYYARSQVSGYSENHDASLESNRWIVFVDCVVTTCWFAERRFLLEGMGGSHHIDQTRKVLGSLTNAATLLFNI